MLCAINIMKVRRSAKLLNLHEFKAAFKVNKRGNAAYIHAPIGPISISWIRDGEKVQYRWELPNFYSDLQHGILDFTKKL